MEYTLIRSQRRTIAIHIKNGGMEVRAPMKMPKRDIDRFVASKAQWIAKHLSQSQANAEQRETFTLDYGDVVMFRGSACPIVARTGMRAGFDGERFCLPPNLPMPQVKSTVVQIYRRLAQMYLSERVMHYAKWMKVSPAAIRITGAKTRWGSCSAKKSLNFSWRLMMADDAAIDYVVVHELAHITEMNHSVRFWLLVARILPDYKLRKNLLKTLQRRLRAEDWE